MKMPSNNEYTQKARRISAARLLLVICCILSALLILLQALPALSQFFRQKPVAEIMHSDQHYIAPAPEKAETLLDANSATSADWDTLPGIGPAYAKAIVDYRGQVSRFYFLEDLMNVKGIGEKRLEAMRPFLMELLPIPLP